MRFCIIGAGAMGGLYGGRLALAGHQVAFIDANPDTVAAIRKDGLRLDGVGGKHRIKAPAAADASGLDDGMHRADVALIHTDTNNTRSGAEQAAAVLDDDGFAVTLQNGIGNVETLLDVLGEGRVAGGISYHSAAAPAPGRSLHTNDGTTFVGELDGSRSARIEALAAALAETGMTVEISERIEAVIWTKFLVNCAVNPLAAITGLRVGEIASTPEANTFQDRILDEAMRVINAKGIRLTYDDPVAAIKRLTGRSYNKPSMLQHMEQGRPTEIDALNGALVREGRAMGVATPFNEALTLLVKSRNRHMIQALHGEPIDYQALEEAAQAER